MDIPRFGYKAKLSKECLSERYCYPDMEQRTKPADMIGVTSEDWNKAVQEQNRPVKERSSERLALEDFQPEVTLPSLRQPKIRTFEGLILFFSSYRNPD